MPRFALLRHSSPRGLHWDFFLQVDELLRTWELPEAPQANTELPCTSLPDHRLAYLDYQGPVSDDRGSVTRWDGGEYQVIRQNETQWDIATSGQWLAGRISLRRVPDDPLSWTFVFVPE